MQATEVKSLIPTIKKSLEVPRVLPEIEGKVIVAEYLVQVFADDTDTVVKNVSTRGDGEPPAPKFCVIKGDACVAALVDLNQNLML